MSDKKRYIAFISYSHADERWARRLQRWLERYRVPKRLRAERPELPARLYPVFRDRDELASANDLSESIQAAMADSGALIVICSPTAAASRWVNEEIRHFRQNHDPKRIFCLMVAGQPNPDAPDCAFPPALLRDDEGERLHEPLAADVTASGDGPRNAALKVAAGLLGVGVDELKQRDAQRQARFWSAVAAGSLTVAALTIGLAVVAVLARQDSELRRQQAENLIGFMLGDLRGKLQPIGKLDVLDAVGDQAMDYFAALGERGSDREMLARAMALRQIGEVRFSQGKLEPALASFRQSLDQARALYEHSPENNDYLFELGQAEFWVGYVAWQRNDLDGADDAFQRYMQRSRELLEREPDNVGYQMELAYAYINLGSVARERGLAVEALGHFRESEAIWRQLADADQDNTEFPFMVAETLSWAGSTLLDLTRLADSEAAFTESYSTMFGLHQRGVDRRFTDKYADLGLLLSEVQLYRGSVPAASETLDTSRPVQLGLIEHDSANADWRWGLFKGELLRAELELLDGDEVEAKRRLEEARAGLLQLVEENSSDAEAALTLAQVEATLARIWIRSPGTEEALALAREARQRIRASVGDTRRASTALKAALVLRAIGDVELEAGLDEAARESWGDALRLLDGGAEPRVVANALRAQFHCHLGQTPESRAIATELRDNGFADPRFPIPCAEPAIGSTVLPAAPR